MKVTVMKTKKTIAEALLDDFFKGDENYTGNVQAVEEERSEHDKHWNECRQIMQYSNENAEMKKLLQELVDIGYSHEFQAKQHSDLLTWVDTVNDIIYKAQELLGGEQSAKV